MYTDYAAEVWIPQPEFSIIDGEEPVADCDYVGFGGNYRIRTVKTVRRAYGWSGTRNYNVDCEKQADVGITERVCAKMTNRSLWGDHATTVPALGFPHWDALDQYSMPDSLLEARRIITIDTLGMCGNNLGLVINPRTAVKMAQSGAVHDYICNMPYDFGSDTERSRKAAVWGLPSPLWGFDVIIEDTAKATNDNDKPWVFPDNTAVIVSLKSNRPYGAPTSNTVEVYVSNKTKRYDFWQQKGFYDIETYEHLACKKSGMLIEFLFPGSPRN